MSNLGFDDELERSQSCCRILHRQARYERDPKEKLWSQV
jgi:hypothetical protein